MIKSSDIKNACGVIQGFAKNADFRLDTRPVISFEFADLGEFSRARQTLLSSMDQTLCQAYVAQPQKTASHIEEIDYYGVTIRLICKQRIN